MELSIFGVVKGESKFNDSSKKNGDATALMCMSKQLKRTTLIRYVEICQDLSFF